MNYKTQENLFESIFLKYGKDTDKVTGAKYHTAYENSFLQIREDIKLVFEIGIGNGGGLKGFRDYFPNALIVGLEIDRQYYFEEDRIKVEIGDATKKEFIDTVLSKYGDPDIVIDDASHFSKDIKESYNLLYSNTKFCYVIEDLITQYKEFQNGHYISDGIPSTVLIHNKVDELLLIKNTCKHIEIYPAICFIFK